MSKMKKTIFTTIPIILILFAIIFIGGISYVTPNRIFSTKYYKNPRNAFEAEYTPSAVKGEVNINEDLDIYDIDSNNSLYFAITTGNNLFTCPLHKKHNRYFSEGSYGVYDLNKLKENITSTELQYNTYDKYGRKSGTFCWIFTLDVNETKNNEFYKLKPIKINNESIQIYLIVK